MTARSFRFFVEMKPQAKGRPRFRGKRGFTDKRTRLAEKQIAAEGKGSFSGEPMSGPVLLEVDFFFNPPKAMRKDVPYWRPKRPDLDNLLKTVKDALQPWAFNDDAQVVCTLCRKIYVKNPEEKEGIHVYVREIEQ